MVKTSAQSVNAEATGTPTQFVNSTKNSSITKKGTTPKATEPSLEDVKVRPWQRFIIGGVCISLGLLGSGIGLASITYRLTHVSSKNGLVNGRTVRIQSPVDGTIEDFYARPGAEVKAGQVLAQIEPLRLEDGSGLTLLPDTSAELTSDQRILNLLQRQLQDVERRYQALQTTEVAIATEEVDFATAAIAAAVAEEEAASVKYERFRSLLAAGAVSEQEVDELEAAWETAKADVQQAQSERNKAQVTMTALASETPLRSATRDLQLRRHQLLQEIEAQTARLSIRTAAAQQSREQLIQAQALANVDTVLPIASPFDGVVHSTQHDTGEQVIRSATLLSLLDCNDLWVETLLRVAQANRIDVDQPVRVQFAGNSETMVGEVEFINAVNADNLARARTEALLPAIPANLVNLPLARVRVRVPPTPSQRQTYQFCGVGQSARLTFGTHTWASTWLGGAQ